MKPTAEEFITEKFKIDVMPNELTFFHEKLFALLEEYVAIREVKLPTEEEIEERAVESSGGLKMWYEGFLCCAEWLRKKITEK